MEENHTPKSKMVKPTLFEKYLWPISSIPIVIYILVRLFGQFFNYHFSLGLFLVELGYIIGTISVLFLIANFFLSHTRKGKMITLCLLALYVLIWLVKI
jgi:hypothetical protein